MVVEVRIVVTPEDTDREREQETFWDDGNIDLNGGYNSYIHKQKLSISSLKICALYYICYASINLPWQFRG